MLLIAGYYWLFQLIFYIPVQKIRIPTPHLCRVGLVIVGNSLLLISFNSFHIRLKLWMTRFKKVSTKY